MEGITIKKRVCKDGAIEVTILPMGMTTYAKDEADVEVAVSEALECLAICIEKGY